MYRLVIVLVFCGLVCGVMPVAAQEDGARRMAEIDGLIADGLFPQAIERCRTFLRDLPASPLVESVQFKLGSLLVRTDQFPEAERLFERYVVDFPASPDINEARFLLATASRLNGNFTRAKSELTLLLANRRIDDSLRIASLERRAEIHLQLGEQESAGKDLQELVDRARTPLRMYRLANVLYEMGDLRGAERWFRDIAASAELAVDERRTTLLRLSLCYYQRNAFRDVVELLQPVRDTYRGDDALMTTLAWSLFRLERPQEAWAVYSARPVVPEKKLAADIRSGRELLLVHEYTAAVSFFRALIDANQATPEIAPAWRGLADAWIALGDLPSAVEALRTMAAVAGTDQERFEIWIEVGDLLAERLHRDAEAIDAWRRALAIDPRGEKSDDVYARLIRALIDQGDVAGAGDAIIKFLNDFPASDRTAEILFRAGALYEGAGDYGRALEHYRRIAQAPGTSPYRQAAYESALELVSRLRRWDDVQAIGSDFLREFPTAPTVGRANMLIAEAHYQLARYAEGIASFERALTAGAADINAPATLLRIAWGYYKLGDFDRASVYYQSIISQHPDAPDVEEAMYWLGWLAQVGNDLAAASDYFTQLNARFPASRYAEISLFQLASNYQRAGDTPKVIEFLTRLITAWPDGQYSAAARRMLVDSHVAQGNYRAALETLTWFTEADPGRRISPANLLARGNSLAEAGNLDAALRQFLQLQELFPASDVADEASFNIATIHTRAGRAMKAIEELRRLREVFPQSDKIVPATWLLGQNLVNLRRYQEALPEFQFVLDSMQNQRGIGEVSYLIGYCHEQLGQIADALTAYRRWLANLENPADRLPRRLEIAVLFMRNGAPDEAVEQLLSIKSAARNDEMGMNAQYIIGEAFEIKGDKARAAEEYLRVTYAHLSAPAGALMARLKAGRLYEELGRMEEAIGVYQTIVRNHANTRFGELAAIRIEAIRKKTGAEPEDAAEPPAATELPKQ